MPNTTSNLALNTFLQNEVVDWEQINANFETIDDLTSCNDSGTATASYTGGSSGTATWHYKKYTDGTAEMSAKLEYTNLKCNGGSAAPYYSGDSTINFPISMSSVYSVQATLSSNTMGWVICTTGSSVLNSVTIRLLALENEASADYKQVFITVKGVPV